MVVGHLEMEQPELVDHLSVEMEQTTGPQVEAEPSTQDQVVVVVAQRVLPLVQVAQAAPVLSSFESAPSNPYDNEEG